LQLHTFDLHRFCISLLSDIQGEIELNYVGNRTQVMLDPELLTLILHHLLSNALKFSLAHQPITLNVECSDDHVMLTVSDQGAGIPKQDLPLIFEPFHRAKNVDTIAGGGLGLSIVKQCVELQGGTIDIKSQLGQGTSVQVQLPLVVPNR
jgi:signal transduction histidine kinase